VGNGSGLGLVSMRERVESLEGTLTVTSTPGRGVVVEARVPVQPHEHGAEGTLAGRAARAESA
jgi:signal transduction histidine kinase